MVAISIIREHHDAARRMLALALVLEGASRGDAARAAGMDRQTLRDWARVKAWGRWYHSEVASASSAIPPQRIMR